MVLSGPWQKKIFFNCLGDNQIGIVLTVKLQKLETLFYSSCSAVSFRILCINEATVNPKKLLSVLKSGWSVMLISLWISPISTEFLILGKKRFLFNFCRKSPLRKSPFPIMCNNNGKKFFSGWYKTMTHPKPSLGIKNVIIIHP